MKMLLVLYMYRTVYKNFECPAIALTKNCTPACNHLMVAQLQCSYKFLGWFDSFSGHLT